jgi:hypothetical protein
MAATPAGAPERSDTPARAANTTAPPPVVLDLGKQRRKRIKELRRGAGKLIDEVNASLEELRTAGALSADAQAVVIVVREKRRKVRGLNGLLSG